MPLPEAHPDRLPDFETRRLLAVTAYALVQSKIRVQQAFIVLSESRDEDARQRRQLAESRRALRLTFPHP